MRKEWESFRGGIWEKEINVRDFIQKNYTPYEGDDSFLVGPTEDTKALWAQVMDLSEQERAKGGVLDMDTKTLCSEDCKGLCPRCGADLNQGPCSCAKKDVDPRLAVLAKLLEKDK